MPDRSPPLASWRNASQWRPHELGRMDVECTHCGALHWKAEVTPLNNPGLTPRFTMCCKNGSISFDPGDHIPNPPAYLRDLFSSLSPEAVTFRKNIRQINSALAYTSVGCRSDRRLTDQERHYIFQVQGSIYHMQGPLATVANQTPMFSQLYFLDPQAALQARQGMLSHNMTRTQRNHVDSILQTLDSLMRQTNPFRHIFIRAKEVLERNADLDGLRMTPQLNLVPNRQAGRQYDLPSQDTELSAFIPTLPNEYSGTSYRDICLYLRNPPSSTAPDSEDSFLQNFRDVDQWQDFTTPQAVQGPDRDRYLTFIRFDHPLYLPLSYVLFYAEGGRGYSQGMRLDGPTTRGKPFISFLHKSKC
jgi:hypothetical protein